MADLMKGKRGLVMGVANERSIAWGIAKALADEGAELAFSYQGEAFGKRLAPLAASVGSDFHAPGEWSELGLHRPLPEDLSPLWARFDHDYSSPAC